jgi:hypothetical protein
MAAFPDTSELEVRLTDDLLEFDGLADYADMQDPGVVEGTAFTIEAWVQVPAGVGNNSPSIYSEGTPANWSDDLFVLYVGDESGTDGIARVFMKDTAGAGGSLLLGTSDLRDGHWHHVVVRQNSKSDRDLIVDLVEEDTDTTVLGAIAVTDAFIGANDNNGTLGQFCAAGTRIREVRLWSDARTDAELKANQNVQLGGGEAGLVAYWKMDEGTGTTLNDSQTAGSFDGTINGGEDWLVGGSPFWTDILADVRQRRPIRCRYGIFSQEERDRIATSGTLEFRLKNDDGNSGGLEGYYSPDHTNARAGWELGIECRLTFTEGATTYYKHRGRLVLIKPTAGIKGPRDVSCLSLDWLAAATLHKMNLLSLQQNVRSDLLLAAVVDNAESRPVKRSFATGQETFAYAADDLQDERVTAYSAMQRIALSEFGYIFIKGDTTQGGTLVFQDRHTRVKDTTVQKAFTQADMLTLEATRDERHIRNRVEITVFPRNVGASPEVLYILQTTLQINPGDTETLKGRYRDPSNLDSRIGGLNMITPVAATDYNFGSAEGGGGDLNSDFALVTTFGGSSVEFAMTNNGAVTGYVNLLQARGTALRIYDPIEVVSQNVLSQRDHFRRVERMSLAYQESPLVGKDYGDNVLSRREEPRTRLENFSVPGFKSQTLLDEVLAREPGERISAGESVTGIPSTEEFFINGVELTVEATPNGAALTADYTVVPASTDAFWLLGTVGAGELGQKTWLGF